MSLALYVCYILLHSHYMHIYIYCIYIYICVNAGTEAIECNGNRV